MVACLRKQGPRETLCAELRSAGCTRAVERVYIEETDRRGELTRAEWLNQDVMLDVIP